MDTITAILSIAGNVLDILGALVLVSTLVVRLTPSPSDDEAIGKIYGYWLSAIKWLPTIGINPQTKKLEEVINELKSK